MQSVTRLCQQGSNYRYGIIHVKGHFHFSNVSRGNDRSHFRMRKLVPALCYRLDYRDLSLAVLLGKQGKKVDLIGKGSVQPAALSEI